VGCLKTLDQLYQSPDTTKAPRERIELALRGAARAMGPVTLFRVLPLDILSDDPSSSRPHLLSLLKGSISCSQLAFFGATLAPLAEQVLARSRQCQQQRKPVEAQNYHLIYLQIWALFPGFCTLPTDGPTAFPSMAKQLGVSINSSPDIRPTVCAGLHTLIDKSLDLKSSAAAAGESTPDAQAPTKEDVELATATLDTVGKFAKNFLPILFNVYTSLSRDSRGYVLELVRSYLKVTEPQLLSGFFGNAMQKALTFFNSDTALIPAQVDELHALFDLLCAMAPHLAPDAVLVLYRLAKTNWQNQDIAIQKKAYRAMTALLEAGHFAATLGAHPEDLQTLLLDANLSASSACKKQRLTCLSYVVSHLADDDLHLIPSFLPEVILGAKESNEQARLSAFELLLALARRMERGGRINMDVFEGNTEMGDAEDDQASDDGESDDDDEDDGKRRKKGKKAKGKKAPKAVKKAKKANTVEASLEEFVKMVVAGLAGTSQHMMSATMTCLSRLVYEYLESLRFEIIEQIISSALLLLHSKSRELIKAVLGFVKMIVVSLDPDDLGPFLPDVVSGPLLPHTSPVNTPSPSSSPPFPTID